MPLLLTLQMNAAIVSEPKFAPLLFLIVVSVADISVPMRMVVFKSFFPTKELGAISHAIIYQYTGEWMLQHNYMQEKGSFKLMIQELYSRQY